VDVLEELAIEVRAAQKIIDYREIAKLKNTYVDALPKLIDSRTGRVHTTLNQAVSATGDCRRPIRTFRIFDPIRAGPADTRRVCRVSRVSVDVRRLLRRSS